MKRKNVLLFPALSHTIKEIDMAAIPIERLSVLQLLIDFIQSKKDAGMRINLIFICTHNSRRSHLSQIWAQTMAAYFGVEKVCCYSGGTEATAVFPTVIETLEESGFGIDKLSTEANPVYSVKYGADIHPIIGFSKRFDHPFNPKTDFAAVMTCSHADENCPFIPGAEQRIPLTFDDPKEFDDTPVQAEKYRERSLQIATELFYVFSKLN